MVDASGKPNGQSSPPARKSPLGRLVGHPRTAIFIGNEVRGVAEVIEAGGGKIHRLARIADGGDLRGIDLVMFGDSLERDADPLAAVRRRIESLSDGGHVIVDLPHSPAQGGSEGVFRAENAIKVLEDAGLEVMRVEDDAAAPLYARFAKSVHSLVTKTERSRKGQGMIVARRPPRPGPLSLTVGMLTLNEIESIEPMIADIRKVAPDAKILVIDSSSDATPDIATKLGARVVRQLPPRGHGPAMERLMYEAAKDTEALIYLDCDFTYPTATIKRIRELLESGVDVVNTSRTHHYPKEMPVPNFVANRFFAATAQIVHGIPTTDVHSGMRGYRSSVIRAFDFDGEGDALPLDTLILPAKAHYHVAELPIPYFERVGPSKLAKLRGTAWTFIRIATAIGEGTRVRHGVRYRHVDE
jgi:hypothetical protein